MPRQRRGGGRAQRSFSKRRGAGGRRLAETREASGAVGEGQSGGDRGSDKQRSSDACAERRPSPRAVSSRREEAAAPTASALAVSAHAAGTLLGAGHEEAACGEESAGGGGVSGWADACEGLLDPKEAAAEMRHLASVRRAFQLYEADALCDVARIERHLLKLSASERELLGPPSPEERVAAIRQAVAVNQNFIDLMLLAASSVCPPDSQEEQDADDSSADVYSPSVANAEWGSDEGEAASLDGKRQPEADSPRSSSPGDVTAVPGASMDAWQKTLHSAECCSRSPRESALKQQEERGGLAETGEGREEQSALQGTTRSFGEEPEEGFDALESADPEKLACNMSKVRSTLRQFVREWAEEGALERAAAYGPLLEALEKYLPINAASEKGGASPPPRVLCPGSGLGRLPFEVMRRGYACQGNEFSYFMLIGSDFLLNSSLAPRSLALQPYCLSTSNRRGKFDHLETAWIPDVAPRDHVPPRADFSMCAGEFVEVYGLPSAAVPPEARVFDGVLTSFFLDTAKNVLVYIKTIAKVLRRGGLWANIGPLLYHYAEMPHEMSIELSAEEVLEVVGRWFELRKVEWRDCYYTSHRNSMMQVQYHCLFFVAIRNGEEAPEVLSDAV